jgi:predicted secreted hydrolase
VKKNTKRVLPEYFQGPAKLKISLAQGRLSAAFVQVAMQVRGAVRVSGEYAKFDSDVWLGGQ